MWLRAFLVALSWFLVAGPLVTALTGCESLQRKFTRKRKPGPRPTPVVSFRDYSQAMTPLDRYRKHYMMFDYWNEELLAALQRQPLNPKRYRRASAEALDELSTMRDLVTAEVASGFAPLVEERTAIDRQLQQPSFSSSGANPLWRRLEKQTRQIHRDLFWRNVEDHLKPSRNSTE